MIGSLVGGLATAMTVAALSFSTTAPAAQSGAGGSVSVSGAQVVVVDGDTSWVQLSTGQLRCSPAAGRPAVLPEPVAPLLVLQRMLCTLPTLPADVTRLALPRAMPWQGLMHF